MKDERLTGWGWLSSDGMEDHTFQTPVIVGSGETRQVALSRRITELEAALKEITKGKGRFSMDPQQHAINTIEDMKNLAKEAIGESDE